MLLMTYISNGCSCNEFKKFLGLPPKQNMSQATVHWWVLTCK